MPREGLAGAGVAMALRTAVEFHFGNLPSSPFRASPPRTLLTPEVGKEKLDGGVARGSRKESVGASLPVAPQTRQPAGRGLE